jgi:hypothetical protein
MDYLNIVLSNLHLRMLDSIPEEIEQEEEDEGVMVGEAQAGMQLLDIAELAEPRTPPPFHMQQEEWDISTPPHVPYELLSPPRINKRRKSEVRHIHIDEDSPVCRSLLPELNEAAWQEQRSEINRRMKGILSMRNRKRCADESFKYDY